MRPGSPFFKSDPPATVACALGLNSLNMDGSAVIGKPASLDKSLVESGPKRFGPSRPLRPTIISRRTGREPAVRRP